MLLLSLFRSGALRRRTLPTLALAAAAMALGAMPALAAGTYQVQACTDGETAGIPVADAYGGWIGETNHSDPSHIIENDCASTYGLFMQLKGTDRKAAGDYAAWKFSAPSNTKITDAELTYDSYTRGFNGHTNGLFSITAGGQASPLLAQHGSGLFATATSAFHQLDSRWLRMAITCESADATDCPTGEDGHAVLRRAVMTVSDGLAPAISTATGSALDDARWRQTEQVVYTGNDFGSGVAEFRLYVDGQLVQHRVPDPNGGACQPDSVTDGVPMYHAPKPCPGSLNDTEDIDTTVIPDGSHQVDLVVADATGQETAIASDTKLVANHPPVNDAAPAFTDALRAAQPHVGEVLQADHGTWSGPNLTYAFGWERCEADGSACGQIPGAFADTYTLTADDLGKRVRMAVTATNVADSIIARTALSGAALPVLAASGDSGSGSGGTSSGGGTTAVTGTTTGGSAPTLSSGSTSSSPEPDHVLVGHVAGEPPAATCPQDRAALVLQGVAGRTVKLGYGRSGSVRLSLTCTSTGKALAGARLDVATRTGSSPALASQLTTDAAGHATLTLARGASRAITVGYRMYADDPLARATVTVRVRVTGRVAIRASRRTLHNGQAVTLTGSLAGGHVPRRGVDLAVQWRDGQRWRTFAVARTDRRGRFRYAYRFSRTRGVVRYALRVQVLKGQVDYPFEPVASKAVRITVRG